MVREWQSGDQSLDVHSHGTLVSTGHIALVSFSFSCCEIISVHLVNSDFLGVRGLMLHPPVPSKPMYLS